jgi:putative thioredoxin
MVVALLAEQAVPLFTGAVPEQQVREVFDQLLQVAAQNGVTGTASPDAAPSPEQEGTVPPLHAQAFDAIEAGDYDAAEAAFRAALRADPRDEDAKAGLAQVALLARVRDIDAAQVRQAAAADPDDIRAQFAVADLDLVGGHVDDAFERLLDLFAAASGPDRQPIRDRLLELFGVVGDADPRVLRARTRLASLLF